MWPILAIMLVATCGLSAGSAESTSEVLRRSQQFERAGEPILARVELARAAKAAGSEAEVQLAYAEFLDRYRDPERRTAYEKALERFDDGPTSDRRREILRRLVVLSLIEGDREATKKYVRAYHLAGGPQMQQLERLLEQTGISGGPPMGSIQVPGPLEGFRRMAALSSDQMPGELLPALARNVMTSGYRVGSGAEGLQQTEYMKLLLQYLSQARELRKFAGSNQTVDILTCESKETALLLKILGFRLRNDCGPSAVLETVNPSRAFLSIDSAFPLADLEEAYRRERSFHLPYGATTLPVIFGPAYWESGMKKYDTGEFIDAFLRSPALTRLYVAMANLHEPTAIMLREQVSIERLKNQAHVLDFFGGMFEVQNSRAMVPGGLGAGKAWENLIGVSPADPAEFFMKLMETDDGWAASFFDSLWRADDKVLRYLTETKRLQRFYLAVRGRTTSPGPARPIFRANTDLLLLTVRLHLTPEGQAYIPGGLEPWKKVLNLHEHTIWDGKRNREAATWRQPDDIVESMYVFCRRAVDNDPLRMFISITNVDRHRKMPLRQATVERLTRDFGDFGQVYSIFAEAPMLRDETIIAYLDLLPRLAKIRRVARRADAIGMFQALTGLWQIFVREGQISEDKADEVLHTLVGLFQDPRNDLVLFDSGRAGIRKLLIATGSDIDAPQRRLLELLAGDPAPGDRSVHAQVVEQLDSLFNQQQLISLKTLFDLADHLERVSRGENFNVAMANRLALRISEVPLPRSELSTFESNAVTNRNWVAKHLQRQQTLNLRRMVDQAQENPEKLAKLRGELAPILRDSLVGFNYIHYSPPGAELIRANPLFVRGHDFLGIRSEGSWRTTKVVGAGWPSSAGGRLVGSLVGLPYALAEAEQNFLVPVKRQALIWQDLAPQILLNATVPKWWRISPPEQHFVGLHLRLSEELVARASFEPVLHTIIFSQLRHKVEPARLYKVRDALRRGHVQEGLGLLTASEMFHMALDYLKQHVDATTLGPIGVEIARLRSAIPSKLGYDRISRLFGVPHPSLTESYRPTLLNVPLFPTLMGYSSRILAESWESSNLYWAALADELHIAPSRLNLLVPQWTQKSLERIFATHLDDWPALWRSMRIVAEDHRKKTRRRITLLVKEAVD